VNDTFATLARPLHQLANPQTLLELVGTAWRFALALAAGRGARSAFGRRTPAAARPAALLEALVALTSAICVLAVAAARHAIFASLGLPARRWATAFNLASPS